LLLCVAALEAFVNVPLTYLIHSRKGEDRRRFSSCLLAACLTMATCTALICLTTGVVLRWFQDSVSLAAVAAFSLLLATQFVREFLIRWILAHLESKRYAILEMVYFAMYVPLLVGVLFARSIYIPVIFLCMAACNAVIIAIWWRQFGHQFANVFQSTEGTGIGKLWTEFSPLIREQIHFGRWIAADSVCSLSTMYFCNWFLLLKTGAAGAGVYGACMTIVLLVNPFLNGLMSVFAPLTAIEFERGRKPALSKLMLKFGLPLVGLMLLFSAFLWFAGDWLTTLFFGDRYAAFFEGNYDGRNQITFLIGMTMPSTAAAYILACGIMACGKPKYTFISSLFGLFSLLGLCLFLPTADLEWCAIYFAIAVFCMALARLYFYRRCAESK
jgi:O-antigen/teichoic acid export membrane protein